ncbi:MAG: PKD domain-containing protein [Acidobacteria bacterium]|nr:PKD domain-containing protein [Acidobacteriota bacterium]
MRLRIGFIALLLAGFQAFAATSITPTTTLSAETANNTSGASAFQTSTNGNAAPANVSKVPTSSLLYGGSNTTIYAHFMAWFGVSYHINIGYSSPDPAQVKAQVTDMLSRGIAGAIIDWYGQKSYENSTSLQMKTEAESRNGAFRFAIMEDAGAISSCANTSGCDVTGALINDLNYVQQTYITSPAYITWNGNPVIFYFGVEQYSIDWTRVRASTGNNVIFVFQNDGGFTRSFSNGGFSWVMPSSVTSSDPAALSYMNDFYNTAHSYSSKVPVGAAYKGFNDSLASWGSGRLMQQQCGQTWLETFTDANSHWSSSNQLALFQLVTWNDYEEGTEIETGIDNCFSVNASVSGSGLNWTISGNENTIDHYTVFISSDGQNLMSLGDYPVGTRQMNLGSFGFGTGNYSVYVKAVGKPSIVNHMSAAATYTIANGPAVVLNVTPTSGIAPLAVSASAANSTDNQGTITSYSIDFGDGTVANTASANHNYANTGNYTITATVTDSAGLSGSQSAAVSVTTPQPPVARLSLSPATGSAPLAVTASTSASTDPQNSALSSTIDFGDGTTASGPSATHTYNTTGSYTVKATVINALHLSSQASASVTVNAAPTITVSQPANNANVYAPIHVVASGTAPSGVDALQIYLDNTLVYQANAGSFDTTVAATPGKHLIVVQLWDKLGNYYKSPLNVTVVPTLATSMSLSSSTIAAGGSTTATISTTSGTMTSSTINWGDGSSSPGPTATHVYGSAGTYTISGSATDGMSTVQSTSNLVVDPLATVVLQAPTQGTNVPLLMEVKGYASSPIGIANISIYIDSKLVYQTSSSSSVDQFFKTKSGSHQITFQAQDSAGFTYQSSATVSVSTNSLNSSKGS